MQPLRTLFHFGRFRRISALLVFAGCLPAAAAAYPTDFFGTFMNTNPPAAPAGSCFAQVINQNDPPTYMAAGFSNIGDFGFNLLQCLNPPSGSIELDFGGGNTLKGAWSSVPTPTSTPMLIQIAGDAVLTGGTGSFAGVSGWFKATGYLDRRDPAIADSAFVFRGQLVPEPSTYALLLAGIGVLALVVRRRRG